MARPSQGAGREGEQGLTTRKEHAELVAKDEVVRQAVVARHGGL
jgi:hypothetical protein